jgi:hypothetical protein
LVRRLVLAVALLGALAPAAAHAQTSSDASNLTNLPLGGASYSTVQSSAGLAPAPISVPTTTNGATTYAYGSLVTLPPGLLVRGSGPAIYVIYDGQRLPFPDWSTYLAWGGASDLSNVAVLLDSDLATIPDGPAVSQKP